MTGIDISNYQASLDLATAGVPFAILKVTEGTSISDRSFSKHYAAAQGSGIPVGAYIFSYALTADQARAEVAFALHVLGGRRLALGLYLDIETTQQLQLSGAQLLAIINAFCVAVRAAGYTPGVYSSEYAVWAKVSPPSVFPADMLRWIAHYGKRPAIPCDLWQSSDSGTVHGYSGPVDLDVVISKRFEALVTGQQKQEPEPQPTQEQQPQQNEIDYTVLALQACMAHDGYWPLSELTGVKTQAFRDKLLEYAQDVASC